MKREKMIKEMEKKLNFSRKNVLIETVCMPEWPSLPNKKTESKAK